jgi:spermidine synthase
MFALPDEDERLRIVEMDALDFVNDERNTATFDVLHSDLYDATARGPVLDTPEFYAACKRCLAQDGMMTVNLFGDHPSFARNISAMSAVFAKVICLSPTPEGNVIALAFKTMPDACGRNQGYNRIAREKMVERYPESLVVIGKVDGMQRKKIYAK